MVLIASELLTNASDMRIDHSIRNEGIHTPDVIQNTLSGENAIGVSNAAIVKVMDSATNEVIRQIPSEELVTLAKNMTKMEGMLISQKA